MQVLSVTTTPSAWRGTNALAKGEERISTALGLHPQIAHERKGELRLFDELLPHTPYVGEIGLDGGPEFRKHWDTQLAVFDHVLGACVKAGGRIMSIHSRRASGAVLDLLEAYPAAGIPILHWFSGSAKDLDRAIGLGCWFSVGPSMLRSQKGRALVADMGRDHVLTESDGPFAQLDGQSLMPWSVKLAIEELSRLWSLPCENVMQLLLANLTRLKMVHSGPAS